MFRRASLPWLLAHELRITWRTWFRRRGKKKRRFGVSPPIIAAAILLLVSALGVPAALALRDVEIEVSPLLALIVDAASLLVFTLMLSQTLVSAVDAFYERGDLDLLLSSPLPPTRILAVRAVAMAINPAILFWALATPFVAPAALFGHPELLAVYVVIAALALLATAIGLALALALFSLIGPRRTRTVAQILAAVVGAIFVVAAQLPNLMATQQGENFWNEWLTDVLSGGPLPPAASLLAEAALGHAVPLSAVALVALAVFVLVAFMVGRRFGRDAAAAQGADTLRRRKPGRTTAVFRTGTFRATVIKEARLLRRDPGLISQILLRVFYIIPLMFFIFQSGEGVTGFGAVLASGAIAILAGQLAGSIAWITLSAEDAPGLLAAAPVPISTFWSAKLAVTFLPPALLVIPAALALAIYAPVAGLVALVCGAASALSAALINLWLQKPSKRSEFRRSWNSTFSASILELAVSLAWAAMAGMAVAGLVTAFIPFGFVLAILALAYRPERAIRERLTERAA